MVSVRRLDWVLLLSVFALVVLSALLVWSATAHRVDVPWRTEIEPTPQQLEARLRSRPLLPHPRKGT